MVRCEMSFVSTKSCLWAAFVTFPDSKVYGANMGPIWVQQDPGGPHVGTMNFTIWVVTMQFGKMQTFIEFFF